MLGICIKFFHHNYGGMLQSYATVRLLSNYCEDYELIRYIKKKNLDLQPLLLFHLFLEF